jgi:energy-converting hydrogenase A subunit R
MSTICFNLEGPLSPQDSAYNLMRLVPNGDKIFGIISRYNHLLTVEGRPDIEPGDTMTLIAPILVYHGIKEEAITSLARRATLTEGAMQLVTRLNNRGWNIFCISASYKQYALHITQKYSIFSQNIACTYFPLDEMLARVNRDDFRYLEEIENKISHADLINDAWIKENLEPFYREILPTTSFAPFLKQIKPVVGKRKVEALEQFDKTQDKTLSQWIVIGSSIADFKILQTVDKAGGMAIAFNADEYALPYATISLASENLDDIWPVLESWQQGKRPAVESLVKKREKSGDSGNRAHFHWISGKADFSATAEIHRRIRQLVNEEAAKPN